MLLLRLAALWTFLSLVLVPSILLLVVAESSSSSSSSSTSSPTFDLSQYMASSSDILYDASTRAALRKLRKPKYDTRQRVVAKTRKEILNSLEDLYTVGNYDKTTLSLRGMYDSELNSDSAAFSVVVSPFLPTTTTTTTTMGIISQFIGVFGGHFGYPDTARFLLENLPQRLSQQLLKLDDLSNVDAVTEVIRQGFEWADRHEPTYGYNVGGSTASILIQLNDTIYMANVGTSQTFVSVFWEAHGSNNPRKNDVSVILESPMTVLDEPSESERILQSGSSIEVDEEGISWVVPPPDRNDGEHPGLPMSRSIGVSTVIPGVIADPKIGVFTLDAIRSIGMEDYAANACRADPEEEEEEGDDDDDDEEDDEDYEEEEEVIQEEEEVDVDSESSCPAPKSLKIFAMAATESVLAYPDTLSPWDLSQGYAASFFVDGNSHPHTISEAALIEAANAWEEEYGGQLREDMAIAACKIWEV